MSTKSHQKIPIDWMESSIGKDLISSERIIIDEMLSDIFGYNAVQFGMPTVDFLSKCRLPNKIRLSGTAQGDVLASSENLPIKSNSTDLVVIPHGLEYVSNPHSVIREIHRILVPGGSVVMSLFNPISLWGVRNIVSRARKSPLPWSGDYMSLWRVKDWLELLSIEVETGCMTFYRPPFGKLSWREKFNFMEKAGDRWWPIFGGLYVLRGVKRVKGMRLTIDGWSSQKRLRPAIRATQKHAAKIIPIRREFR